jgi:TRAP-type C4-dicarboxylate transport system substrate-binding protein
MKRGMVIGLSLLIISGLLLAGCGGSADRTSGGDGTGSDLAGLRPIVWQAASGWPRGNIMRGSFEIFADLLAENTEGRLRINMTGPETFPGPEQINMLRRGTLDIINTTPAYYLQNLPEGSLIAYTWGTREEREAAGLYAFLDEAHRRRYNATFLTEVPSGSMHIYMKDPIRSIADFRGKRLRSPAAYLPALKALGATTMFMSDADTVDALQQGVIDGAITASVTYDSWNYHEIAPYTLYPPLAFSLSVFFANVDSVEALPVRLREILYETIEEAVPLMEEYARKELSAVFADADEKGVIDIHLKGEEAQRYYDVFFRTYLDQVVRPERGNAIADRVAEIHSKLNAPPKEKFVGPYNPVQ